MPADNPSASIQLRGAAVPPADPALKSKFIQVRAEFAPGAARSDRPSELVAAAPGDIIEIEFEDRQRVWMRADEYQARFGAQSRDAAGALEVQRELEPLPPGQQLARGPLRLAVKALRVLGVDLAGETASRIAKRVEAGRAGLVRCKGSAQGLTLEPAQNLPTGGDPWLLLIHGTGSSTTGSFSELWKSPRWTKLAASYQDRILAFDHETLSQSPIANAAKLIEALPKGARLHLLTHSRGGLVGELLTRAPLDKPFSAQELDLYPGPLATLAEKMKGKGVSVDRFVRVACPALGTTLASGRLDRWFSVIGSVCGISPAGTMAGEFLKDMGDFITAVIHERTNPATLPGLEAMMPESPFIQLANWPTAEVPGDLAVIAGDIERQTWAAKLVIWLTDRFYDGDHDLVVNTPSMYGGVKRAGLAIKSFHKGPDVSHFNYFRNDASVLRIVEALSSSNPAGFEPIVKPRLDIARSVQRHSGEPMPAVFVLPGIMGSELAVNDDHVWLDIPDLVFGGLRKLHINAAGVRPVEPVAQSYGALMEFLAATHKVIPFPFDWRLPVENEADRLAKALQVEFDLARRHNQPVRLLAHSMGGLVARTMTVRHQSLWQEVCGHPGARLVMLGTPNGGSHCITELLTGKSSTLAKLSLIDLRHNKRKLLEIISRFPGVLSMLPKDAREDYFSPGVWSAYQTGDKDGKDWVEPAEADLAAACKFRQMMDGAPVNATRMVYLAGRSDATPAAMKLEDGKVKILATARGDGSVTWESGVIAGIPTYYCNTVHGNLASDISLFGPIRDLLERGQTTQLSKEPAISRGPEALFEMPPREDELYPTREVLVASALGASLSSAPSEKTAPPIQVRVVHGHLQFARHPVLVGHYGGDTIISAESHLDRALGGSLSDRQNLGLYPGPIATSAIFSNPSPRSAPPGAIVVGLGSVGELTASNLIRTVSRALLEYTVASGADAGRDDLGVTALLIGVNAGGISVADSVFAMLQAVRDANAALSAAKSPRRIAEIEFIEIYQDRALQAANELCNLSKGPQGQSFRFAGQVEHVDGGRYRVRFEEPAGWWQRLLIRHDRGELRFTAVTRRARSEVTLVPTKRKLVDQFIEQSVSVTQDNREVAKTLFELLLPNGWKDQAPDQDDMVVVLDEESAAYPWELLEDGLYGDGKPFAVKHGMVRQLESEVFREQVRSTQARSALVVGDPVSSFPELKGAQEEARSVSRVLRTAGYAGDEPLIRPTGDMVIRSLYKQPYRILHLAGHGVYNYQGAGDESPVTGMILGDGIVLSPSEVQQMRVVPELVFLNCCHLGKVERPPQVNRIAANLATQFIRNGVRAVVAAGWAVDDQAASTFARVFYEQMLGGETFGKSVLAARQATYEAHGSTNTWGAYQCYGDPDYRLEIRQSGPRASAGHLQFVHPIEATAELDLLTTLLSNRSCDNIEPEWERLSGAAAAIEEAGWLSRGQICSGLARAYAAAGKRAQAIRYYRMALNTEDGGGSLRDMEQLLNLEVREAAEEALQDPAKRPAALRAVQRHIRELERILRQKDYIGTTSERLSILANAYKTKAILSKGKERHDALTAMAARYREAFERSDSNYALLNWLAAEVLRDWQKPGSAKVADRIPDFAAKLERLSAGGRDAWSRTIAVDAKALGLLAGGACPKEELAADYRAVKDMMNYTAYQSVFDHLEFMAAMAPANLARDIADLKQALI